jgi:alpha-D-ribose 1-methylphosphonate 5-triphosphate diphosphatase PhnM
MKSSNPEMTKERVITSIDEYINMMENERKVGHEQLEVIWNEKVESRKQVVANAEQRIAQIQTELKELVTFVQNESNEIASAINECNINKANFDTTVDFLVNNLMSDKNKLSNALN